MTRFRRLLLTSLLVMAGTSAIGAQETSDEEQLALLLDGALTVSITARVVDQDQNEIIWDMDLTRITVSGRAVSVRLEGTNIVVEAEFTPYPGEGDDWILVAEGRTWLGDSTKPDSQYRTSFTTLPIRLGEPVLFLPLGTNTVPVETERFGKLNIELEVSVESYQS